MWDDSYHVLPSIYGDFGVDLYIIFFWVVLDARLVDL